MPFVNPSLIPFVRTYRVLNRMDLNRRALPLTRRVPLCGTVASATACGSTLRRVKGGGFGRPGVSEPCSIDGMGTSARAKARGLADVVLITLAIALAATPHARAQGPDAALTVRTSRATGVARFVTATDRGAIPVQLRAGKGRPDPRDFLATHGGLFGVTDSDRQLVLQKVQTDLLGHTHTTFQQIHRGVPVFAGLLRVHSDARGQIIAANGTFIPDIKLNTTPVLSADDAAAIAVAEVAGQGTTETDLSVVNNALYVFRANLARGVPGPNHLVYEVEVGNGANVREFVYVDAHKGHVVDQITGIHEAIDRDVYDQWYLGTLLWSEGGSLPYGDVDVDHLIDYAEDTYNLVASATNGTFLSWDGADGTMPSVHNDQTISCPNAHWVGIYTGYCPGVTSDDIVAHEWAHAYTDATHNLIYQWQSGALNESYSDIFGETVDLLNGAGTDTPDTIRSTGGCSLYGGGLPPVLDINAPAAIAGTYPAAGANFNPTPPVTLTADVELVNDGDDEGGAASVTDACQSLVGFTSGRIALIDRGACPFVTKVINAQNAGAVGAIVVNNDGDYVLTMGGSNPSITIPSVMIGQSDGDAIKGQLGVGVNATITLPGSSDDTYRWLAGEDATSFGGAIRDMWNPNCFGDPGRVSDTQYYCGTGDGGGVHTNSSVPNHAFALLVDGGTYNGYTITGIGLTKAFHIYWRAESVYQVPATNFVDHADALEQSCEDLRAGVFNLYTLSTEVPTGSLSGQVISQADCGELAKVIAAVELRTEPTQCGFTSMLDPNAPSLCEGGDTVETFADQDWEGGLGAWTVGTRDVANVATFDTPDWAVVGGLPGGRAGSAAFVADLVIGDCGSDTEAGVLYLESPVIPIRSVVTDPQLAFDHWVATELNWDGGNVKISVNGGPWTLIPASAFDFNAYPGSLNVSDNPIGGEEAFTGTDGGTVSGSWGQSQIDLSAIPLAPVSGGDYIQLRFEMGLDGCNGVVGWYVDEVRVYHCCAYVFGDLDGNGIVGLPDIACVLDAFAAGSSWASVCPSADLATGAGPCAGDGSIDLNDVLGVLSAFEGMAPCPRCP